MSILYVYNGDLLVKDGKLARNSGCCCEPDGPPDCDRGKVGCCCFGVGSIDNVDECDCNTMGGTFRTNCSGCTATDGGNGGDDGNGSDGNPPSGYCNICRVMSIGFRYQDYNGGVCSTEACPGNYGGAGYDTCSTASYDCATYAPVLPWKYSHCDLLASCSAPAASGLLTCLCADSTTCVDDGCGQLHEAYSYITYHLSGSRCDGGVSAMQSITDVDTYVGGPCTAYGNKVLYKEYIVHQLVGQVATGSSVSKNERGTYLGVISGPCFRTVVGFQDSATPSMTCT